MPAKIMPWLKQRQVKLQVFLMVKNGRLSVGFDLGRNF